MAFHQTVYEAYQMLLTTFNDRMKTIDASKPFEHVVDSVYAQVISYVRY
ncbi:hypothetical protein N784_08875 [Pontibacillus litoralis JSM 072002]|uniref:Uncharacterized protein n=1 Tax=Pontibacillus litoralis JSM 072002 TaxID=1385512 RepID=A0A0A5FXJ1_9BACI|nr:hypothetical protein N784_08875 [Pontibacillus litoralis JSM 072002]